MHMNNYDNVNKATFYLLPPLYNYDVVKKQYNSTNKYFAFIPFIRWNKLNVKKL